MTKLSDKQIRNLKLKYREGDVIELIEMPGEKLPSGLRGCVTSVDDLGQIHVDWDNGSTLALTPGIDIFRGPDAKENIEVYSKNDPRRKYLADFAETLNKKITGIRFTVQDCYFDQKINWKYTTIVAENLTAEQSDPVRTWPALTPREQLYITENIETKLGAITKRLIEKYRAFKT